MISIATPRLRFNHLIISYTYKIERTIAKGHEKGQHCKLTQIVSNSSYKELQRPLTLFRFK